MWFLSFVLSMWYVMHVCTLNVLVMRNAESDHHARVSRACHCRCKACLRRWVLDRDRREPESREEIPLSRKIQKRVDQGIWELLSTIQKKMV